ncbi:MAG: cytochrome P450 [Chloroflexi bacterium]|nr:cytochrome P450 [Chloroflexota bacterium]MCI0580202.1 cytochrome P450 [Chloroflexota bacterium]MCI0646030.1 cytochrome P450 [Chloroflexota bacterium]MCI0727372.1 cytochrome P450 [Chloroflexota bacterium]
MSQGNDDPLSLANLLRPEVRANPYPLYEQIRLNDPVHWDEAMGFWVLTRYVDVASALHNGRLSKAQGIQGAFRRLPAAEQEQARPLYDLFARQILYADPPYHTRLRGLVNKAFTPRAVEQMRPHVQQVVDSLLDVVEAQGEMDAIGDLALPLPVTVILEMLGMPVDMRAQFKQWSADVAATIGIVRRSPDLMERALDSLAQVTDCIADLSEQARRNPGDDLMSALVAVVEEGERLTQEELVANVLLLLVAGHETTINLIGNGLLSLLQHPKQMEKLRDDPSLMPNAVEEMMRYDNPVQIVYRSAAEAVEIGGKEISRGQLVNVLVGAANRDPAQFSEPDRFDVGRPVGRHVGLGLGIHFCLGAPLARLEGQIAFTSLLRRFPELRLASETLEWQEHPTFRGLKRLLVAI